MKVDEVKESLIALNEFGKALNKLTPITSGQRMCLKLIANHLDDIAEYLILLIARCDDAENKLLKGDKK